MGAFYLIKFKQQKMSFIVIGVTSTLNLIFSNFDTPELLVSMASTVDATLHSKAIKTCIESKLRMKVSRS